MVLSTPINILVSLLLLPFVSASVTISTRKLCSTEYGGVSVSPVPSTTLTTHTTQHSTVKTTTTPTVTLTPKPKTTDSTTTKIVTVTSYSTTVTYTVTSTVDIFLTSTGTTTHTIFSTTTTTTTEPTPTSTIPTPNGFTYPPPVPSPPAKLKRFEARPVLKRKDAAPAIEERDGSEAKAVQKIHIAKGQVVQSPAQYPTSVVCTKTLDTIYTSTMTKTASATTTTVPTPTITHFHTTTSTTTTSLYEFFTEIFTTTTQTATIITYQTLYSTSTTTETATLIPPSQTSYAACASPNVLTPPSGYFFQSEAYSPPSYQVNVDTPHNTTYDCCVACIQTANCKVAQFFSDVQFGQVSCTLNFGDSRTTCDAEHIDVTIGSDPSGYVTSLSVGLCEGSLSFSYH